MDHGLGDLRSRGPGLDGQLASEELALGIDCEVVDHCSASPRIIAL